MTDLTSKGVPNEINWTDAQVKAYVTLKKTLTSYPILHLPSWTKQFDIRTDASNKGLGAILMQEAEGTLFIISYISKKLNKSEQNYSTSEKECLAIVWAIKKFKNYIHGTEFIIETDHDSLQYLDKAKFINPKIMRWPMILQQYRFIIRAIKGSQNHAADYLNSVGMIQD